MSLSRCFRIRIVLIVCLVLFFTNRSFAENAVEPYLILWDVVEKSGQVLGMSNKDGDAAFILNVPVRKGNYTYRVAIGASKSPIYGAGGKVNGKPVSLELEEHRKVRFTYDSQTHRISAEIGESVAPPRQVVLVGNLQDELGHEGGQFGGEWDPAAETTRMEAIGDGFYRFSGTLPPGRYEYKVAIGGSWAENYGLDGKQDGPNIPIEVPEEQEVSFYYNDKSKKIADSTWYKMPPEEELPRLLGSKLENSPGADLALRDHGFTQLYSVTLPLTKGDYVYGIAFAANLYGMSDEEGGKGIEFTLAEDKEVTIFFDAKTKQTFFDDGGIHDEFLKHDTYSELYRQPVEALETGREMTLRFHAKSGDVTSAVVFLEKKAQHKSAVVKQEYEMSFVESQTVGAERLDLWEVTLSLEDPGVYGYKFRMNDFKEYGDDSRAGGTGEASVQGVGFFPLTVYDADFTTPDWLKEAIMYQIFPDRFYNGDPVNDTSKTAARGFEPLILRDWETLPGIPDVNDSDIYWNNDFFGGDLEGIRQKLDYLQSLGVTVLYLNPIFSAASNHKYDTANYDEIDPLFGEEEDFYALVEELAERGMYLIVDGVFNHAGDDSIYFDRYHKYEWIGAYEYWPRVYDKMNAELLRQKDAEILVASELYAEGQKFSPHGWHNWFDIENRIENGAYSYRGWSGYDSLPAFREPAAGEVENPLVPHESEINNRSWAEYMLFDENSVARRWIKKGISGWRMDVAAEVDSAFWRAFRKEIKSLKLATGESPVILGETWTDASHFFLGDQFDSVMNYGFRHAVQNVFLLDGDAAAADEVFQSLRQNYPREAFYALMNLIDSHDTARSIYLLGGGEDTRRIAEKGVHFDYELGKSRLKLAVIFQMGYPGVPAIYYGDEAGLFGAQDPDCRRTYPWGNEDKDLLEFYRRLAKIRSENKKLFAHGELFTLHAEGDLYVYARKSDDRYAIVALNRGGEARKLTLELTAWDGAGSTLRDHLDEAFSAAISDKRATITIPAMSGRMLLPE